MTFILCNVRNIFQNIKSLNSSLNKFQQHPTKTFPLINIWINDNLIKSQSYKVPMTIFSQAFELVTQAFELVKLSVSNSSLRISKTFCSKSIFVKTKKYLHKLSDHRRHSYCKFQPKQQLQINIHNNCQVVD